MRKMNRNSLWSGLAMAALVLLIAVPGDAFGRPRSSSSRSRPAPSRSRSASKPAPARRTASKPAPKASRNKSGSSSKKGFQDKKSAGKKKSKSKTTKADAAAYNKAKSSGKAFNNRGDAMKKFSSNPANAKKFRSDYKTKPTSRPGHIPNSYTPAGSTTVVNINHHAGYGYGSWSGGGMGIGTFLAYSVMADVAMRPYMDRQMMNSGYHVGAPVVYRESNSSTLVLVIIMGVIVVGGIAVFAGRGGA